LECSRATVAMLGLQLQTLRVHNAFCTASSYSLPVVTSNSHYTGLSSCMDASANDQRLFAQDWIIRTHRVMFFWILCHFNSYGITLHSPNPSPLGLLVFPNCMQLQ
jgi:hypothetical protein